MVDTEDFLKDLNSFIRDNRGDFSIIFIDDEEVTNLQYLHTHGFKVVHHYDVFDIESLSPYDIIICDIQGVGKKFGDSKFGGMHIVDNIKREFPEKYVIVTSNYPQSMKVIQVSKEADEYIKKDDSLESWIKILDNAIQEINSPVKQWKRIRQKLLNDEIDISYVAELEKAYIKAIKKKDETLFSNKFDTCIKEKTTLDYSKLGKNATKFVKGIISGFKSE